MSGKEILFETVEAAAKRLAGIANKTPILTSRTVNRRLGAEIYLKSENVQRAGAFKFRGAYNAMVQLSEEQKKQGVLTYSSGNHAQAVALVGKLLGIRTTVVMPNNAPRTKRAATEEYGAQVIAYDPEETTREKRIQEIASERGGVLIPPYDHHDVIAGQGTAAVEMIRELKSLDMLLVPCGGGGLLSGSAVAAKHLVPDCQVIGIEPELADDATQSFYTGTLHTVHNPPTIADGTRTPFLGKLTFPLILKYVDAMKTVSERSIIEAVRFLLFRMKTVVEPSGALGVAALLGGAVTPKGRVGIILSGGNMDEETLRFILSEPTAPSELRNRDTA